MALGSSRIQSLSTEGVNKIQFFPTVPVLFHPLGFSHTYIPEPIIPRGTQELKARINFKQSTWLQMERKMTYPKYNQNALGRTRKREVMLKIQLIKVHNIGMRHLCSE